MQIIKTTHILPHFQSFPFDFSRVVLFDIETTGFSRKHTSVYMIGMLLANGEMTQFFSDDGEEEALLRAFYCALPKDALLIHYNGSSFDLPFLEAKSDFYRLGFSFDSFESIDVYKEVFRFRNILHLTNLKQKTVEELFDKKREEYQSGKELISVYREYLYTKAEDIQNELLLHNADDLLGLLSLFPIFSLHNLFSGGFHYVSCEKNDQEVYLHFIPDEPLPCILSWHNRNIYYSLRKERFIIRIPILTTEMKFFYPDYKNYYYLPKEDMAVHKSLAVYVEKDYRRKAKAFECYKRMDGSYLYSYSSFPDAMFRPDYESHDFFVAISILDDKEKTKAYVCDLLSHALSHSEASVN